jgi:hypothetical protein
MSEADASLRAISPILAGVPGVAAVVLGGSRARGVASESSDYDIGLYFRRDAPLDVEALARALAPVVDDPPGAAVTAIGEWGPWIVGGAWLKVGGMKVDLLYREIEAVEAVIADALAGRITMHYQPGHPHGFCSAHWMGEAALCRPLADPAGAIAALKAQASPYPEPLRAALLYKFQWEIGFAIDNAELAATRGEQTHVAGCAYRALACLAQVLFALNRRYLINEKGALAEAAGFPHAPSDLPSRVEAIWRAIGRGDFARALAGLRGLDADARALTDA